MIPLKKTAKINDMIANVFAALRFLGSLKLGTALLMASTPVNEDEPAEKAFKNSNNDIPGTASPI